MTAAEDALVRLAETGDQLRAGIARTTADLEAQDIDPFRAVDVRGRPILLDALASLGQIEAAAAQLLAAQLPGRRR